MHVYSTKVIGQIMFFHYLTLAKKAKFAVTKVHNILSNVTNSTVNVFIVFTGKC